MLRVEVSLMIDRDLGERRGKILNFPLALKTQMASSPIAKGSRFFEVRGFEEFCFPEILIDSVLETLTATCEVGQR